VDVTTLLRTDRLHAGYGKIVAVRDLDIRVEEGEIVALLGANGAGKSTTLGAIAGLVDVKGGRIEIDGRDVTGLSAEEVVRRGVSLVPEGRRIFSTLTIAENLAVGAAARRDAVAVAADEGRVLALFPILSERYRALGGTLSGGEQQQLAIARALMARPRVLLLDEPSLGLAPILVKKIFELIAQLRSEDGLTILLVEQNVHRSLEVCDRAYIMRVGKLLAQGTRDELLKGQVMQAYLGSRGLNEAKIEAASGQ
jgi:branched-chain amino acid transport system ATP-binding protein